MTKDISILYKELNEKLNHGTFLKLGLSFCIVNSNENKLFYEKEEIIYEKFKEIISQDVDTRISLLFGKHGAGKSTLLRNIALESYSNEDLPHKYLLCDLNNVINELHSEKLLLDAIISNSYFSKNKNYKSADMRKNILNGKMVLLLDSLDELFLHSELSEVDSFVNKLVTEIVVNSNNQARIVIAIRTEWNIQNIIPSFSFIKNAIKSYSFNYFEINGLHKGFVEQYIYEFFRETKIGSFKIIASRLLKVIEQSEWASDVVRVPLHLNIICNIIRIDSKIEFDSRMSSYDLFKKYIELISYPEFEIDFYSKELKSSEKIFKVQLLYLLAKECVIKNNQSVLIYGNRWKEYDLRLLRKIPILRCEEDSRIQNFKLGFSHKSFQDYFFAEYAVEELINGHRDLFDKIELDYSSRKYLVGAMTDRGKDYIRETRIGWGLPIGKETKIKTEVRQLISNYHSKIIHLVLEPNNALFEEWINLYHLIKQALVIDNVKTEPQLLRSIRYGIVVLDQIFSKQSKWKDDEITTAKKEFSLLLTESRGMIIDICKLEINEEIMIDDRISLSFDVERNLLVRTYLLTIYSWVLSNNLTIKYNLLKFLSAESFPIPEKVIIIDYEENIHRIRDSLLELIKIYYEE